MGHQLPRRIRFLLSQNHELLCWTLRLCLRKIFAWQRRQARKEGVETPHCGAISFVQRFGSLLNLNCHFHHLVADGVFASEPDSDIVEFHPLSAPLPTDIQRINQQIARAIEKRIHEMTCDEANELSERIEERFNAASDFGPSTANLPFNPFPQPPLCARAYGYSLHAQRTIEVEERASLERLCRYAARPALSNRRLSFSGQEISLELKRPLADGRSHLRFSTEGFIRRLATLIPPPQKNLTRYFGVFAPAHPLRPHIVPAEPRPNDPDAEDLKRNTRRAFSWADLLKRVFAVDIFQCPNCTGKMKIISVLHPSEALDNVLSHVRNKSPPR